MNATSTLYFPPLAALWLRLLLNVMWTATSASAVQCYDCVGDDCSSGFCQGTYCYFTKLAPGWRPESRSDDTANNTVRGCLKGDLLEPDIGDQCEASAENLTDIHSCFCSKDYCNGPYAISQTQLHVQSLEMTSCFCSGPHCMGRRACLGELCWYSWDKVAEREEKGCLDRSMPLFERRALGGCVRPGITSLSLLHYANTEEALDRLLQVETCTCDRDWCNRARPNIDNVTRATNCPVFIRKSAVTSHETGCYGEFCFEVTVTRNATDGAEETFRSSGCATYNDSAPGFGLAEELKPVGCANFHSSTIQLDVCFQTDDPAAIVRAKASQRRRFRGAYARTEPPLAEDDSSGITIYTIIFLVSVVIFSIVSTIIIVCLLRHLQGMF